MKFYKIINFYYKKMHKNIILFLVTYASFQLYHENLGFGLILSMTLITIEVGSKLFFGGNKNLVIIKKYNKIFILFYFKIIRNLTKMNYLDVQIKIT